MIFASTGRALIALFMINSAASAAIISKTYDIKSFNFVPEHGTPNATIPPYSTLDLNFTVTFDDTKSFGPTTSGLTINSFNLPYASEFQYSEKFDVLTIATNIKNDYIINDYPNTYGIFINNALSSDPLIFVTEYTDANGDSFASFNTTLTSSSTISAVPLPASAPMFGVAILGLAGVGYAAKRKKADAAA